MNVWQDTTGGNSDISQESIQFFIVLDGQGNVPGNNTTLLVVPGGVAGQFQNFGAKVFQNGSEVNWRTGTHTGGVFALSEVSTDTTDRELQTSLGRTGGGSLLISATALSFSCCDWLLEEDRMMSIMVVKQQQLLIAEREETIAIYIPFPVMMYICCC
jgi:hypothetical protein